MPGVNFTNLLGTDNFQCFLWQHYLGQYLRLNMAPCATCNLKYEVKFNFKLRTFSPKIKLKCLWSSINKHFLNSIFRWTFAIHMQQVQERLLWNLGTLSVSEMSWFLFLCQVLLIYWAFSWDESTWRFFFRLRFKI